MDAAAVIQTLLQSQQLAATQQQRVQATQLFEQVPAGGAIALCGARQPHTYLRQACLHAPQPPHPLARLRDAHRQCPRLPCAQLKAGEVRASAGVATELIKPHQPAELQVLGYTLLQHLVRSFHTFDAPVQTCSVSAVGTA